MPIPQPWVVKARQMVADQIAKGKEPNFRAIAKLIGQTPAHVQMRAGPKWQGYKLKDLGPLQLKNLGFDKRPSVDEALEFLKDFPTLITDLEEINMSERQFIPVNLLSNGIRRTALRIECSKRQAVDCLVHAEFSNKAGPTSNIHAANVFRHQGWIVGGGPRADICPKCFALIRDMRRDKQREEESKEDIVVLDPVQKAALPVGMTAENFKTKPEAPKMNVQTIPAPKIPVSQISMKDVDKTAKRLIDAKMDEVYDAKKGGYLNGYSDAKVATDLGVVQEWVALIRDFGHGPDTTALDLRTDVVELDKRAAAVMEAKRLVEAGMARIEELDKSLNDRLANFEKVSSEFQVAYNALKAKVSSM